MAGANRLHYSDRIVCDPKSDVTSIPQISDRIGVRFLTRDVLLWLLVFADDGRTDGRALLVVSSASLLRSDLGPASIHDDLIPDILQRLPAAAVLRFRAVCKQWRDLVDEPRFRVAHHPHRPAMRLICHRRDDEAPDPGHPTTSPRHYRVRLDAVDPRSCMAQPVFRFDVPEALPGCGINRNIRDEGTFQIHRFLLASYNNKPYLCNPAMRRWGSLAISSSGIVGFYPHRPSGEFHLLIQKGSDGTDIYDDYGIVTPVRPGRNEVSRYVMGREHDDSGHGQLLAAFRIPLASESPPALVAGRLHWLLQRQQPDSAVVGRELLVFDTVAETFRRMRPPPPAVDAADEARLLELDGKLTVTAVIKRPPGQPLAAQLWVLQEYERHDSWACKLQVPLPADDIARLGGHRGVSIVSREGDVMVECTQCLLQCDAMGRLQARHQLGHQQTIAVPHMFRETLVPS